jgi:hypothetical protein
MSTSFRVYIDESGDEGFVFKPDGSGSSRWLVISATVIRTEKDLMFVRCLENVHRILQKPAKQQLHFSDLKHEQRVAYVRQIAELPMRTVSILVYKPCIREPEKFQNDKFLLYRYITRYLLERVSWLCRDNRIPEQGDGTADIVFSNRSIMSYDSLREYLDHLKNNSDSLKVTVDWDVIKTTKVKAVEHSKLAGLQVADAVASSIYYAVNLNRYGNTEDRYMRLMDRNFFRAKGGRVFGYGIKFWPDNMEEIKKANPHIEEFAF